MVKNNYVQVGKPKRLKSKTTVDCCDALLVQQIPQKKKEDILGFFCLLFSIVAVILSTLAFLNTPRALPYTLVQDSVVEKGITYFYTKTYVGTKLTDVQLDSTVGMVVSP